MAADRRSFAEAIGMGEPLATPENVMSMQRDGPIPANAKRAPQKSEVSQSELSD